MKMKNWIWLLILLLTITFNSEAVPVQKNTAPDGVVLDSVNVLSGRRVLLSQEGKTVSITCKQSSSTATSLQFQLRVNNGPGGTWTLLPTTSSPVWVLKLEAGNQYKCVATNSAGRKETEIYESDVISIKINENPCKLAEFKSLNCTCKATSKITNPNITVQWYGDGFIEGSTVIYKIPDQGVNTALKDGVINRNQMDYRYMIYSTFTQCRLWKYNGIELPAPLHNQILHQTEMYVTYFPDEILTNDTYTGKPDISTQGEIIEYTCRTVEGKPDPTVIYQQKRRGFEQWEPIPDPQPRKVPLKGKLKGFDTAYKFKADFKLHNGTSFRCAVKENPTFPEPRQFNPIIVYYFTPVYKKSSENKTHAAYIVTVNSNLLTQQVTCDPPAVVQKLSNYQWNITIPILNSIITDYRGRCLADGVNERVFDVTRYHHAGPTDKPVVVVNGWNGIRVAGFLIGILILLILVVLIILWCHSYFGKGTTTTIGNDSPGESSETISLLKKDWVTSVQKCLKETYIKQMNVESFKEVPWSDETINFNKLFAKEHAKIRPQKRSPKRNEKSEEQPVILPDDFEKLFTYDERNKKRVCLVGDPGMGKTTQVVKQVLTWTTSTAEFLATFSMLFYIPLNELPADNACIYTYIYETYLNPEIRKDLRIDSFKEFLRENAEKAILFLDGFDELKNDKAKEDIVSVTNKLQEAHIVITTRESGGSMIVTDPKFTVASICGFEKKEVIDTMKRKFPQRNPKQLFNKLRKSVSPLFKSIYFNPQILHMLCFLYMNNDADTHEDEDKEEDEDKDEDDDNDKDEDDDKDKGEDGDGDDEEHENEDFDEDENPIPSKLTDIYIDLTCFLISKRKGLEISSKCFFGDIGNSKSLKEICQVAYETLIKHQNSFSENRFELEESKRTALTCKEVSPRWKSDRSVQLRFINEYVHEFLAAVHSVVQFNNSGEIPWSKCAFDQLPDELEKYGELYPRFMSGLLYRYKHNRGLGELFKTLIDERLTVEFYFEDLLMGVSTEMMLVPDYERFIELLSESYYLSEQLSIYLAEADWPGDAISEIFHYIGKISVVDIDSRLQIDTFAKILEHKQCQIELVHMDIDKLKSDEYRVLETAIESNTSLQGLIIRTFESMDEYNQYLTLCKKSKSMNWFMWRGRNGDAVCYRKLEDCGWIKTSHVITSEDALLISGDTNTHNTEEILFIGTEPIVKLLVNIHKSYPSLKHLFLQSPELVYYDKATVGELRKIILRLRSLYLSRVTFDNNLTGRELDDFNTALKSSEIETIQIGTEGLYGLTTDQRKNISDSVGSMNQLKRLFTFGSNLQINRILAKEPQLTVLRIDLLSEEDHDALVQYLSSDKAKQLIQVCIYSRLDKPELKSYYRILQEFKHGSSLRSLQFDAIQPSSQFPSLIVTQDDIASFVKSIVELIDKLRYLSLLYIRCKSTDPDTIEDNIKLDLKKLNKRTRVKLSIEPYLDS